VLTKHVPAAVLDRHLATLGLVDYSHDDVTGVKVDQQKLSPGVKNLIWGKFAKHHAWKPSLGLASILAVPVRALESSVDQGVLVSWCWWWTLIHILAVIGAVAIVMKLVSYCSTVPVVVEVRPAVIQSDLEPTVVSTSSSSSLLTRARPKLYFCPNGTCIHMDPVCSGMNSLLQVERRACKKCFEF
jgi:hypothetical protein